MARRDDREYRAIFEGGATQPAAGVPAARFPARWGGAGMHRRPNRVPSAAAALGTPNAAGLSPRAAKLQLWAGARAGSRSHPFLDRSAIARDRLHIVRSIEGEHRVPLGVVCRRRRQHPSTAPAGELAECVLPPGGPLPGGFPGQRVRPNRATAPERDASLRTRLEVVIRVIT